MSQDKMTVDEVNYEIERKFLIEYPEMCVLEGDPSCSRIEILQTYLGTNNGKNVRVRQWIENGECTYIKTEKKKITNIRRIENESVITKKEYLSLIEGAEKKHSLEKVRYRFTYDGQCFEVDVYPFWDDVAVLEIELESEDTEIRFPDTVRIIKEVTEDSSYTNVALAKKYGREL